MALHKSAMAASGFTKMHLHGCGTHNNDICFKDSFQWYFPAPLSERKEQSGIGMKTIPSSTFGQYKRSEEHIGTGASKGIVVGPRLVFRGARGHLIERLNSGCDSESPLRVFETDMSYDSLAELPPLCQACRTPYPYPTLLARNR